MDNLVLSFLQTVTTRQIFNMNSIRNQRKNKTRKLAMLRGERKLNHDARKDAKL